MDDFRLSFLGQRWHRRSDEKSAQSLIDAGCPPLIAQLLAGRGIQTMDEARAFLDSGLHRLHDPWSLKGVGDAVDRIVHALKAGETIGVYGDYDVDGQTSAALMARLLGELGAKVRTYIPHRTKEGYGLHIPALKQLADEGCSLVITVDCGISAFEEARWAKTHGLDLIITDHHQPHDVLPEAVSIINPQLDLDYPCRDLAGCGVAFKLAEALSEATKGAREWAHRWIELVAIGTVADVVPLVGENRSLVKAGLEKLNAGKAVPGLMALRAVSGLHDEVTAGHVGFVLAPRLNAVGRVSDPTIGLQLLMARTYDEALPLARRLEAENDARRRLEEEVAEEARKIVEELFDPAEDHGLVVDGHGWHPGVIGIVASRLAESYYRPTVVLSVEGELARGSARSIPGFDLYGALEACSEHFIAFGGHQAAAGLTLATDDIEAFRSSFREVTRSLLSPDDLIPRLSYDAEVQLADIDTAWVETLKELEPYGMGNPSPVLIVRHCRAQAEAIGKDKTHLRLRIDDPERGRRLDGIGFGMASELLPHLRGQPAVDIAFVPDINEWNGRRSPQLRLRDVRAASLSAGGSSGSGASAGAGPRPEREAMSAATASATVAAAIDESAVTPNGAAAAAHAGRVAFDGPPLADVARVLRGLDVLDMRGVVPERLFSDLMKQGRTAFVVPALPEMGFALAQEIASLSPELQRRSVVWDGQTYDGWEHAVRQALAQPGSIVIAPRPGVAGEMHQTLRESFAASSAAIVLWHAPAHPRDGLLWLYALRHMAPGAPFVLAMAKEQDARAAACVEASFPDRDVLSRVYVAMRDAARRRPMLEMSDIAAAVEARWPRIATRRAVEEGVAIFAELGLVEVSRLGVRLVSDRGKVDLTQSLRYNECVTIRSEYRDFAARLRQAAAGSVVELLIERGTPWWPQSTSKP